MSIIILKTDGSCIPNPGEMGIGIVIEKEGSFKIIGESAGYGTNNQAEYIALIRGLGEVRKIKRRDDKVKAMVDSQLICSQIAGTYKINKPELKKLCEEACRLIELTRDVQLIWSRRTENGEADKLAKRAVYSVLLKKEKERREKRDE